jgi:hypothetical protein
MGSLCIIEGTAMLRKALQILSILTPLSTFIISIVYKPAMAAVVVASAGTILPALILTVIQSISGKL